MKATDFDDMTWMFIEFDILTFAADDMIEGTPLGQQITEEHIRKGIRHYFEKDGIACSEEVINLIIPAYKEYCANRDAIEKFCMQFLSALMPSAFR